jgi:homoserine acetyltransferase
MEGSNHPSVIVPIFQTMSTIKTYPLGDFPLKSGGNIPNAFIAYKTFGDSPNPAIIYPSWYSGAIADNEWLIGDNMALSPKKYFIVVPALFGNGQSSSPSNTPDLKPFPDITFYDNVKAQHQLVTEGLGIKHARCVLGWSMGRFLLNFLGLHPRSMLSIS